MGADFYFRMGTTHAICQDYAVAGESIDNQYAVLSDGCSGVSIPGRPGSPYTDFGARFLTMEAQQRIGQISRGVFQAEAIINHAALVARVLYLPTTALDATLLVAVTTPGKDVLTIQTGDGVVASRHRDGTLHYRTLRYGNGMPFYLSYLLESERMEALLDPKCHTPEDAPFTGIVEVIEGQYVPGTGWLPPTTQIEGFDATSVTRTTTFLRDECDVVLLMSDGVESFQTNDGTTVPLEQVLEQLFAFKGFAGQFLVRRCSRFLEKFCVENGWRHLDDFSAAGISLGTE